MSLITLDQLESTASRIKTYFTDLIDALVEVDDSMDTRLTVAENEIDTLQSDMSTAQSDITTLQSDVNDVETRLDTYDELGLSVDDDGYVVQDIDETEA